MTDWMLAGQTWLLEKANRHFSDWAASPAGARWCQNRNKSPYWLGYSQPEWMEEAREALGRGDEEAFKAIKLENL